MNSDPSKFWNNNGNALGSPRGSGSSSVFPNGNAPESGNSSGYSSSYGNISGSGFNSGFGSLYSASFPAGSSPGGDPAGMVSGIGAGQSENFSFGPISGNSSSGLAGISPGYNANASATGGSAFSYGSGSDFNFDSNSNSGSYFSAPASGFGEQVPVGGGYNSAPVNAPAGYCTGLGALGPSNDIFNPLRSQPVNTEWTEDEQEILEYYHAVFASDPVFVRYAKIASKLPLKSMRDVALRCRWMLLRQQGN